MKILSEESSFPTHLHKSQREAEICSLQRNKRTCIEELSSLVYIQVYVKVYQKREHIHKKFRVLNPVPSSPLY